jgi:hypothetical protein
VSGGESRRWLEQACPDGSQRWLAASEAHAGCERLIRRERQIQRTHTCRYPFGIPATAAALPSTVTLCGGSRRSWLELRSRRRPRRRWTCLRSAGPIAPRHLDLRELEASVALARTGRLEVLLSELRSFPRLATFAAEEVEALSSVNGWAISRWRMSQAAVDCLADVYDALITTNVDDELIAILSDSGVDVIALFYDEKESESRHRTTRADLLELAAAAAWVGLDDWPIENLHMPNVPKGSRDRSDAGIDAMSVRLDDDGPPGALSSLETLFIGSVKHTTVDVADLRRKLVESVTPTGGLTSVYLMQQIRVLAGNLSLRGRPSPRLVLFAPETPGSSSCIFLGVAGCIDADDEADLVAQLLHLPSQDEPGNFRLILVENIASLHQTVATDD